MCYEAQVLLIKYEYIDVFVFFNIELTLILTSVLFSSATLYLGHKGQAFRMREGERESE